MVVTAAGVAVVGAATMVSDGSGSRGGSVSSGNGGGGLLCRDERETEPVSTDIVPDFLNTEFDRKVKVKVNCQLTRLVELACQLAESLSLCLTINPSLLVDLGIDLTSFPSKPKSNSPSSYSPSCMNNSSSSSSSEEHSMLRLAELYEQLAESVLEARRLP
uniref:Uncharacterized protein n=1 Tax=Lactuca sativa TaxID=4236 RepID=A0A9R1VW28_LACSA|nr:hypothetical protein LSAT_V11C400168030 [Lactuca sativa]